jgi:hypothetical protein
MVINKIKIRGFRSFGNNEQIIELESDKGQLILMTGGNGHGKSLQESTNIDIDINLLDLSFDDLILFLDTMEWERDILLYIKKNNRTLYEKAKHFRKQNNKQKELR